ncbi:hypothetical protein [Chryseobacterium sp. StRB126]|uniref:hypothetical protein n=1 Tax=Chryseobacterium sp. StRB126 TaxID=878220 RepID=UPI000AC02A4A|nr:hypothetical protein [Chryseobacterium sp. StRB126]
MGLLSCVIVFVACLTGYLYAFKNQIIDFTNRKKVYISETSTQVKKAEVSGTGINCNVPGKIPTCELRPS